MTAPSGRELWGAYLSTLVCAYGKCLLWNPSDKNQRFLPAPFDKGAFLPSVSLPSGKGSENSCTVHTLTAAVRRNTSLREGGGLGRSPKTEGASGQETNLTTGGGTSPGLKFSHAPSQESAGFNRHRVSAVMSRCQPISKPSAYSPLAPSVTAKATGGSPAVPAPTGREPLGCVFSSLVFWK